MRISDRTYRSELALKRAFDLVVAIVGLIVLLPVFAVIALLICLDSPGSPIYCHKRIGKDGQPFNLYKFRSMRKGGNDSQYLKYLNNLIISERNGKAKPYRKMNSDPRVTRVGKFLRCFYLDELPQLINILKGEMSVVGPRPHVQIEVDHYLPEQQRRMSVRPGVTGLWQVKGKAECTFNQLIELDLEYIDQWGFWKDIQLIFNTAAIIFHGGETRQIAIARPQPSLAKMPADTKATKPAPTLTKLNDSLVKNIGQPVKILDHQKVGEIRLANKETFEAKEG